ncbi:PQQ-dependent sugar dehydrogenase [Halomonas sp. HNIBRBA4712]|uniref:PQQ-dependent sugar dehydrogenase n=1 Tax=Halomonas sp. HNIBRBA4712 TaxID=3373087 RepID=UPI003745A0AC
MSRLPAFSLPRARPLLGAMALLAGAQAAQAEITHEAITTDAATFSIERVADGLTRPWAVAFLPDGRYLVSERRGTLNLVTPEGQITPLSGMPEVSGQGQGGLLDVVLHPDFGDGEHDWIYFTWSKPDAGGTRAALSRVRFENDALGEVEELFEQDRASGPGRHYGSRLAWLGDGTLMMSVGDRGSDPSRAQARDDHAGSTLRLTETGGVPADNPFVDDADTLDEIYSLGNRNIQGMAVRGNGQIWVSEHGPRTGDELNLIEPGANYGWPEVTLGNDYATNEPIGADSMPGMVDPKVDLDGRFAPSGLAEVSGERFSNWQGNLLAGGLASEKLARFVIDGEEVVESEVVLQGEVGRIRDVREGPDGGIYLLTDSDQGGLYRLMPVE